MLRSVRDSLVSRPHFSCSPEKWAGQLPIPFWFKHVGITVQRSNDLRTSEMDVDRATLAAAYRVGFSQSLLFTWAFLNSQSSWCDVTVISKYWNQNNIGTSPNYFHSRSVKSSLGTRLSKRLVIEDSPYRGFAYSLRNGQTYRESPHSCDYSVPCTDSPPPVSHTGEEYRDPATVPILEVSIFTWQRDTYFRGSHFHNVTALHYCTLICVTCQTRSTSCYYAITSTAVCNKLIECRTTHLFSLADAANAAVSAAG